MIRFIFWVLFYVLTLGLLDIEVKYKDGLKIKLVSWVALIRNSGKQDKGERQ